MANGTIAFDTLSTSGQITGTAKSVDTDYVVSGSAKVRCSTNAAGTSIHGSLNVSSLTDTAAGKQTVNLSSSTADTNYTPICGVGNKDDGNARETIIRSVATSSYLTNLWDGSAFSDAATSSTVHGDLA